MTFVEYMIEYGHTGVVPWEGELKDALAELGYVSKYIVAPLKNRCGRGDNPRECNLGGRLLDLNELYDHLQ